ncbi:MAG: restriction endonuclease subunit S [Acetobacter sp.]|nr:restriction endonuclease subunit S [Acetobacter sp.]
MSSCNTDTTEWETRPLGEVFAVRQGFDPAKIAAYWENGTIPFVKMEDVRQYGRKLDKSHYYVTEAAVKGGRVFPANSFIISTSATIGEHAFVKVPFITNRRFTGLSLKPEFEGRLDRDFIFFYLYVLGNWCRQNVNVGTFAQVRMGLFRQFPFPIPPLPEQQKLATFLDEAFALIDDLIDNAQRHLELAHLLQQRQLEASFEKLWQTKPIHFLADVCVIERGSSPRPIKNFLTTKADGVNWVKIGDVSEREKFVTQTKEKITQVGSLKSRRVYPGDLILTNSMSYGRPYIMKIEGCVHDGWFVLRPKKGIYTDYFYYVLSSPQIQKQFGNLASGAIVLNIRSELVKKASFPIPPYDEQVKLAQQFETITAVANDLCDTYQEKLNTVKHLKTALLAKVFHETPLTAPPHSTPDKESIPKDHTPKENTA